MLFNSIDFFLFLPFVFLLYWFVFNKNLQLRNLFLLTASYFFYGCWDARFLILIFLSSAIDFICGWKLAEAKTQRQRKLFLAFSVFFNLAFLGFFKYYHFFSSELIAFFQEWGIPFHLKSLHIILPVGISFYTFQSLSYIFDIYRRQIKPTRDPIAFFAYVSFFPQLVAGPIERAQHLLPQFHQIKVANYELMQEGFRRILWGLFAKIVVADTAARMVDFIFENNKDLNGISLGIGAALFAIQIYGDFSGYSNIAIGTAKLFGFHLMDNFNYPFFSKNIKDFWARWHISLTRWFRDYVYIPLGGNRKGKGRQYVNVAIVFLLSGLWHGANWTFIIWGALHGFFYIIYLAFSLRKEKQASTLGTLFSSLFTFALVSLAFVFFRAASLAHALDYLRGMAFFQGGSIQLSDYFHLKDFLSILLFCVVLFGIEYIQRKKTYALDLGLQCLPWVKTALYYSLLFLILFTFEKQQSFLYFQF